MADIREETKPPAKTQPPLRGSSAGVAIRHGVADGAQPKAAPFVAQPDTIWPRGQPLDPTGFLDLTTYTYDMLPFLPGMIVDMGLKEVLSRVSEENTASIPFCAVVVEGTQNGYCKLPAVETDIVIGLAMYNSTLGAIDPITGTLYYRPHASVSVLRVGRIGAIAPADVKRGDPVYGAADGSVATVAVGGAVVFVPGASWATDTKSGQLGVIQLNVIANAAPPVATP